MAFRSAKGVMMYFGAPLSGAFQSAVEGLGFRGLGFRVFGSTLNPQVQNFGFH